MTLINWRHKQAAAAGIFALCVLCAYALFARAQSNGCTDATCSYFETDTDGWQNGNDSTIVSWVSSKTLGLFSNADGVMVVDKVGQAMVKAEKDIYLQTGQYHVVVRAGNDLTIGGGPLTAIYAYCENCTMAYSPYNSSPWGYGNFTSGVLTVDYPGNVRIVLEGKTKLYFDYVEVVPLTVTDATPTPDTFHPTATPRSATAVPPTAQATPAPTGTAYCVPVTPTPAVPAYSLTPTPTPNANDWALYEDFGMTNQFVVGWTAIGTLSNASPDHTNKGEQSFSKALPYQSVAYSTTVATFNTALTLIDSRFAGSTFWVDGWAQADVVPAGETAYIEVWGYDSVSAVWRRLGRSAVSYTRWYPFHLEITDTANIASLAFVGTRTDQPAQTAGAILLDDVTIYNALSHAPRCDGTVDPITTHISNGNLPGSIVNPSTVTTLSYPQGKDCPPAVMAPNNLWGMILTQLTLFLDAQMAFSPSHVLGTTRDLAQQYMMGPLGGVVALGTVVFDWRVPLTMLGIYLAFQVGLGIVGIWKLIRRTFFV